MKKFFVLVISLLITVFSLFPEISLLSYKGYVQIKTNENAEWAVPKIGSKLQPGFIIYTGFKSYATIQTKDAKIEIKPLSQMSIKSLLEADKKVATDIDLKYGKIKAEVNTNKETKTLFKVRSANSTASVRGTIFTFGEDSLFVERGTVELLTDNRLTTLVQKNEHAFASKMDLITTPFRILRDDAYVNTLPIGFTDTENNGNNDQSSSRTETKAKVIIRINVIK